MSPRPVVGVGAVLIDEPADVPRVLLIRRAHPPHAGRWSLPGGKVEAGERLADALRREVEEETGLLVEVGPLLEVVELITADGHFVVLDYYCRRLGGALAAGDDAAAAAMVPVDELPAYAVSAEVARVVARGLAVYADELPH